MEHALGSRGTFVLLLGVAPGSAPVTHILSDHLASHSKETPPPLNYPDINLGGSFQSQKYSQIRKFILAFSEAKISWRNWKTY